MTGIEAQVEKVEKVASGVSGLLNVARSQLRKAEREQILIDATK